MAISKKTGKIIRPKTLAEKYKAAIKRKHNKIAGKTKPRKRK